MHLRVTFAVLALALALWLPPQARADTHTVAVIGTGEVGGALGMRFAGLGHRVVYGSRDPDSGPVRALLERSGARASAATQAEAVREADIVVLAVPWDVVEDVVRELGDLTGRLVIDPTNPRSTADDGYRDFAFEGSGAERIQALVPRASVVKAFNTLSHAVMLEPAGAGGPVTVPLVGDDEAAKRTVAALARSMGLEAVDAGPLRHARIVEGMHYLRFNAGRAQGRFNYHLRPESAPADAEGGVRAAAERWAETIGTGDADAMVRLYAEDAVLHGTGSGVVRQGHEAIHEYFASAPAGGVDMRFVEPMRIRVSDGIAVNTGNYAVRLASEPEPVTLRYSFVYRRVGEDWLIIDHHSSRLP